jgi:hypothetical protein
MANKSTFSPANGDFLKTDGGIFNHPDWLAFQQKYDVSYQTVMNGASLLSRRCSVITEYYSYGIEVPEGRELIIFNRETIVGGGSYNIDVYDSPNGFTVGNEAYKSTLRLGATTAVTSKLWCGVTVGAEPVLKEQNFTDSGDLPGAQKVAGATSIESVIRVIPAGKRAVLTIQRNQAVAYTSMMRLICWEQEA